MASSAKDDPINETILKTPQPTATSTVNRTRQTRPRVCLDDSLGIAPLESMDSTGDSFELSKICRELEEQCSLANYSLQRANEGLGIPSMYLKPSEVTPSSKVNSLLESTISESDLSVNKQNCSTPRKSIALSQSLAQFSSKVTDPNMNLANLDENFRKVLNQGSMYRPADEAENILLRDEISWSKRNEMPLENSIFSQTDASGEMSIGKYFMKRSDTLTGFSNDSLTKDQQPVALADTTNQSVFCETDPAISGQKSLSISTIQKVLQSNYPTDIAMKVLTNQTAKTKLPKIIEAPPESKRSPYRNSHFHNEVVNKENFDAATKSPGSSRSSSRALTSLPEGKLPLDATASELIWGCVKLGKCVTQDFCIRNKSDKRLGLQLSVSGHEFKIRKDLMVESEGMSSVKIIMRAFETKAISISFIPTKIGAAADQLTFKPLEPMEQTKKQYIKLFGYGGHSRIEYYNVTKDTTGKYWLSLGKIDNNSRMTQKFSVKNTGTLPSFMYASVMNKDLSMIKVIPDFFILLPQEEREIVVDYILNRDTYTKFVSSQTAICEVGNLCIFTGTEANRGRLRRLSRKLTDNGSPENSLGCILVQNIGGEVIPQDLTKMRESVDAYVKILQFFNKTEMIVTIEKDPDQTIIAQPDETMFYQTLCEGLSVMEATVINSSFQLEPTVIFLMPPKKLEDSLFFTSNASKPVRFEVCCEPKGLEIIPINGQINNGQEVTITVRYSKILNCTNFTVKVYIEDEVLEASVKVRGN